MFTLKFARQINLKPALTRGDNFVTLADFRKFFYIRLPFGNERLISILKIFRTFFQTGFNIVFDFKMLTDVSKTFLVNSDFFKSYDYLGKM